MPESASERQAVRNRQSAWMRERDIALERGKTSDGGNSYSSSNVGNENAQDPTRSTANEESVDVTLMSRISSKIESAVRSELSEQIQKRNVEKEIEQMLCDKLSSHTCPICMFVMTSRQHSEDGMDHSPLLLCPCGHNLCQNCISKLKKPACPYCRTKIEHKAINRPLLEMITLFCNSHKVTENLNSRVSQLACAPAHIPDAVLPPGVLEQEKKLLGSSLSSTARAIGKTSAASTGATQKRELSQSELQSAATYYISQYRHFTARANVLEQELEDAKCEESQLSGKWSELEHREKQLDDECRTYYEIWQRAKEQLEECRAEIKEKESEKTGNTRKKRLLEQTLEPLTRDREKSRIMILHYDPRFDFSDL